MNKAILVMDMPDSCDDCPGCYESGKKLLGDYQYKQLYKCRFINPREQKNSSLQDVCNCKPDWCPLKELPSKRGTIVGLVGGSVAPYEFRARGWNECIDEILRHDKT